MPRRCAAACGWPAKTAFQSTEGSMQPVIYGLKGETLTAEERDFFGDADPAGYIVFKRNCADREQLRALSDSLRAIHGRDDLPILIDQEGGRVARMQPP